MTIRVPINAFTVATADSKVVVRPNVLVRLLQHISDTVHGTVYGTATTDANGEGVIDIADGITNFCVEIAGAIPANRHQVALGWLTQGAVGIVVAANDALAVSKTSAWVVCDATNDQTDINNALAL